MVLQLLKYAPIREVASLLATIRKIMRRGALMHGASHAITSAEHLSCASISWLLEEFKPESSKSGTSCAAGGSTATGAQAVLGDHSFSTGQQQQPYMTHSSAPLPPPQMTVLTSLIMREWLPPVMQHITASARRELESLSRMRSSDIPPVRKRCLHGLLRIHTDCSRWLVMLTEQCCLARSAGSSSGACSASSRSGGSGGTSRSESTGAATSIGSSLASSQGAGEGEGESSSSCCWDPELRHFILHDLRAREFMESVQFVASSPLVDELWQGLDAAHAVDACVAYAALLSPEEALAWARGVGVGSGSAPGAANEATGMQPWRDLLRRLLCMATRAPTAGGAAAAYYLAPFTALVALAEANGCAADIETARWRRLSAELRAAVAQRGRLGSGWAGGEQGDGQLVLRLPLDEARRRLQLPRLCSNPACIELEGDCEAERPLKACAGCGGAAAYCCRACQVAHWKAGHKAACGKAAVTAKDGR
ncbi:hypothetical protein HYH02_004876 [Chlamydomonas schloesseri]|uniref:phytol kinase n=1 Tax=Chlamydomonas schloesseri TaxID=2026947 RepID=A0A835WMI9_9CHLO|nr:hypothetical protein HYH02_004876 [Chlamydomonas schloesseri]|eukprot:KAG2450372.1 hypothetical protein HYH02_004876 [Chlamydomonas schloesseri]